MIGYADQLNLYAYVHNDPVNNSDPSGKVCTNGGRGESRCTSEEYDVTIPTLPTFRPTKPDADDYHDYTVVAESPQDEDATREWVKNNPVPAGGDPATTEGTPNNALPGFAPVTSFVTTNEVTGREVVVKVTGEGHPLGNGVVIREVVPNSNGTSEIRNMGEGNGIIQQESTVFGRVLGTMINNAAWRWHAPPSSTDQ